MPLMSVEFYLHKDVLYFSLVEYVSNYKGHQTCAKHIVAIVFEDDGQCLFNCSNCI